MVSHCCLSRVQAQLAVHSHEFPHSCLDLDHTLLCSRPPWLLALTSLTLILLLDFLLLPLNHYLLKDCSRTYSVSLPFFNSHVTSCLHCVPTLQHGDLLSSALSLHLRLIYLFIYLFISYLSLLFLQFNMCFLPLLSCLTSDLHIINNQKAFLIR